MYEEEQLPSYSVDAHADPKPKSENLQKLVKASEINIDRLKDIIVDNIQHNSSYISRTKKGNMMYYYGDGTKIPKSMRCSYFESVLDEYTAREMERSFEQDGVAFKINLIEEDNGRWWYDHWTLSFPLV